MILGAIANPFTWDGLAVWLAAGLTLFIFSFLYKDNPFYRFAEHLFVGLGAGYVVVVAYWNDIATNVFAPMRDGLAAVACHRGTAGPDVPCESLMESYPQVADGWSNFLNPIAAVILGMFLFFPVVAPRLRYLTRYAFAFILGSFSGIKIATVIKANIIVQAQSTIERACAASLECATAAGLLDNRPLVVDTLGEVARLAAETPPVEAVWGAGLFINAAIILVGVLAGLIYFFFSLEHKGPLRVVSRLGIYVLMVGFGASFGLTVMGRVSLLIGRLQFLMGDWLGLIGQ